VTVEENALQGGAGGAVLECLAAANLPVACLNLGLPDRFVEHAERSELLTECGLDTEGIRRAILRVTPQRLAPRAESA
jgi:1-deoxy-D-xylulose-5-phosphate synthase